MKIEIDLDDIFRDEDSNPQESLHDSIRRQVIDRMTGDLRKKLFANIDMRLSEIMNAQLAEVMADKMPALIDDIMNVEYTPVSFYGQKGDPTTFRDEIINSIGKNMKYEPKQYSSDENAFTKAVKSIVEAKTGEIKKSILATVDDQFRKDAMNFAVTELSKRLGLTK